MSLIFRVCVGFDAAEIMHVCCVCVWDGDEFRECNVGENITNYSFDKKLLVKFWHKKK